MEQQCNPVWTSQETNEIYEALHSFHTNPPKIVKEGVIAMHGKERKYITLDTIMSAVRPELAKYGVFIMQHLSGDSLVTILQHKSGQFVASALTFQTMNGAGTNNLQNLGGGLTYLRRYALTAILGIAADEDDDGNTGGLEKKSTEQGEQAKKPENWLNKTNKDGSFTTQWQGMLDAISLGTLTSIDQITKHYKVSKENKAEIEALLKAK